MLILIKVAIDTRQAAGRCIYGLHSKVHRSATDALCALNGCGLWAAGAAAGVGAGAVGGVNVVCFWQINEPCEGDSCALWSCHMHTLYMCKH